MGNHGLFEPRDIFYKCPDLSFPINDDNKHLSFRCNNHIKTSQVVSGFGKKQSEYLRELDIPDEELSSHSSSDYYYFDTVIISTHLDSNAEMSRLSKREGNDCVAEKDKPQISSESYESMVLRNRETSVINEYCVPSKTIISHNIVHENERTSNKFKRGRRMKDFRKDVLPTLASLSEREIWEDLRVIESAVRANRFRDRRINKSGLVSSRPRNRDGVGRR